ncbi:MAG: hypothetical protein JW717_02330 [Marinilabiliaceae bacterium]|nr:hypothetical protein [Marinilabiliaceae bacterium]
MSNTEIKLGIGFSEVKFGMSEKEVVELLDQPDETEEMRFEDGAKAIIYYYDDLGISLSFESEEDYRLMEIAFEDGDFAIKDILKIGVKKDELPAIIKKLGLSTPEVENLASEGFPDRDIMSFDDENLNIWLEDDEVVSLQIGPLWVDDDTISWPE